MHPSADGQTSAARQLRLMRAIIAVLVVALVSLTGGYFAGLGSADHVQAAEPAASAPSSSMAPASSSTTSTPTTTSSTTTTTSSPSTTTTSPPATTTSTAPSPRPPAHEARYVVPSTETQPEAKQLAVDIAQSLTTYEASDDHHGRLGALGSRSGVDALAAASEPLIHPGSWSRGEVVYPQLGGLTDDKVSVMVMTRQTVGSGTEAEFSVVRTLDIRLVRGESGWEFDFLDSAGGTFDDVEDLVLAHDVAADPRIEMPDSARLDIRSGLVSPLLLELMAELADRTPYAVVVAATGHPPHVFETDRLSHHTVVRAIDIIRIGDRLVIDDRDQESATKAITEWLYDHPDVAQVGSPWDLDGPESRRSFTDEVHQDHIHLAVNDGS